MKMKRIFILPIIVALVIACSACQRSESSEIPINAGCTVVYATDGEQALGGNNEDSYNPFTRIWFFPGDNGDYGRVYVGFENFFPQGGMNDQGLFFDGMGGLPLIDVPQNGKEVVGYQLADMIMRECKSVDCVIEYFDTYHLADTWSYQLLFGDAFGNSAIIEPLHVIRIEGSYQVGTNFLQSEGDLRFADFRYRKATEMLKNAGDISVDFIRDVLETVHVEYTQYSLVYDLKRLVVYLYHFHDYENVAVFNLSEELAQGSHAYEITLLFPEKPNAEQWAEPIINQYQHIIDSNIDSSLSPNIYDAYVGTYLMPEDMYFGEEEMSVLADGISLWLTFPAGLQLEFFPKSETSFFNVDSMGRGIMYEIKFAVGEDGKANQLEFVDGETKYTCERQSDEILRDLTPILPVETPISVSVDSHVEPENDEDGAPILLAVTPANEVEDVLVESTNNEGPSPDPIWIALVAGGVILLGGGGLLFVLKSKQH